MSYYGIGDGIDLLHLLSQVDKSDTNLIGILRHQDYPHICEGDAFYARFTAAESTFLADLGLWSASPPSLMAT